MKTSWLADILVVTAKGKMSNPTVPLYESKTHEQGGGERKEVPRIDGKAIISFVLRKLDLDYPVVHTSRMLVIWQSHPPCSSLPR